MTVRKFLPAQRGDTIVEVLIALAILSSAVAISYATATRSLARSRQAQEHSEALKLGERQLELLRDYANSTDPTKNIYISGHGFCIDSLLTIKEFRPPDGPTTYTPPSNADTDNLGNYPAACTNGYYRIGVVYDAPTNVFTVYVRWDSITGTGSGIDQIQLNYKLHRL